MIAWVGRILKKNEKKGEKGCEAAGKGGADASIDRFSLFR